VDRLRLLLTRMQIRLIGGRYSGRLMVDLENGKQQEVLLFSGKRALYSGQCTLYRTFIIHEAVLGQHPLFEYVFHHELQHKRQWWNLLLVPLVVLISLAFLQNYKAGVQLLPGAGTDIWPAAGELLLGVVAFMLPWAFSWIMELDADMQAINMVGMKAYQLIMANYSGHKGNVPRRVLNRLTHPPYGVVRRAWNRRKNNRLETPTG
jgi:hypothetical protein